MADKAGSIASAIGELLHDRSQHMGARPDILVGLIGRGIQQSRTPAMHEREAERLGLSCAYLLIDFDALRLSDDDLPTALDVVRGLGFAGVNVTYPFKQAVMPLLDDVAPEAGMIGAVNTIVFGERSTGHNTDCWGFAHSLRTEMDDVSLDRVALFGAGGAGSAVGAALVALGARGITIIDPDQPRAVDLASRLARTRSASCVVATDVHDAVTAATGVVNATPIGMAKHPGTPFPLAWLRPSQWVADIVYFPRETELLRGARAMGCRTLPGIGMAIGQAVMAFEHFTGRAADMTEMARHFEAAA